LPSAVNKSNEKHQPKEYAAQLRAARFFRHSISPPFTVLPEMFLSRYECCQFLVKPRAEDLSTGGAVIQ
jgi:hypothetical protein